jgi:hypothetical protein
LPAAAMVEPKPKTLKNIGIINSTARLNLGDSLYEIYEINFLAMLLIIQ